MTTIIDKKQLAFFPLFDKFINNSKCGKRLQPNGKRISKGTFTNYIYTRKLLEQFCVHKNFHLRIRPLRYLQKRQVELEKNYWKKFYRCFSNYLYQDCGHYDNYVGQNVKNLKVFFHYLNKELALGVGEFYKLFYVRKEEIPIIVLMPEELNFLIYNKIFETSLKTRMQEVKDVFVFGCTVGLRVSDLLALKKTNLRLNNRQYYLAVRSLKTKIDTLIKLPTYAVEIILKYSTLKQRLLPRFNIVNLNKYIKELMETAGFTFPVNKSRERRGKSSIFKKIEGIRASSLRFCDIVSTHTMRRTAITTMLSLGVSEQIVRKISGHTPHSKEFYRYVLWAQIYQDDQTERMFEKLKNIAN